MVNPTFKAILDEMLELHDKKNADYAGDVNPYQNFEIGSAAAGVSVPRAILVQVGNKIARLANLLDGEDAPNNESIEDTWLDMAVYAVIALAWTRDQEGKDVDLPMFKVERGGIEYITAEGSYCAPIGPKYEFPPLVDDLYPDTYDPQG